MPPQEEIRFGGLAIRYLIDGTTSPSPLSMDRPRRLPRHPPAASSTVPRLLLAYSQFLRRAHPNPRHHHPGILGAAYFREVAAVLAATTHGTPPDPAAIGAVMCRHGLTPAPGR